MLLDVKRKLPSWRNTEITFFLSGGLWCCMRGTEQPIDLFLSCSGTCLHRCIFCKELTEILKLKTQGWSLNFIFNPTWAWKSEANSTSTWKSNGKLNFHGFQFTQPFSTTICVFKTIVNTYANHKTPCSNKGSNTQTLLTLMFAVVCVFAFLCVF